MPHSATNVRYQSIAWLTLAAALAYLCRNAIGVAESSIREDLGLTLKQSGAFMGAFFWAYAIFQVPSGWFAQCKGTRIALTIFALSWSSAALAIGGAPVFWILIAGQVMAGIAQAGIFPASCNSVGYWMPLSQRAFACGLLAAGMQVGAITASGLTGEIMAISSWRWVFVLFATPSILWAVLFFFKFRDKPEQNTAVNAGELAMIQANRKDGTATETFEPTPWLAIIKNTAMWMLCGQQICRAAGYMFFASWFPTFLQETRGVSVRESGYLQALVLTGTFAGAIFGGLIVDWIWRRSSNLRLSRCGVGGLALFSCALLILMAWFVQSVTLAVGLLALGSFFAALAGPCSYSTTIDIGGSHVPQVFGVVNMCGNFAAASCPILVAWLFERTENWNLVLLLFAGVYLAAAVFWVFVNPDKR